MNPITGYFGVPGRTGGLTHVTQDNKAMCGQQFHPLAEFQWCGDISPECKKCKVIYRRIYMARLEANKAYGRASVKGLP